MKKILLVSLFTLLITSCAGVSPTISLTQSAPTETVAASIPATEIPTVAPTSAPATATEVPKLSINVTKSYGEWDLSAFSADQQANIMLAAADPDHAPKEAKDLHDFAVLENIKALTGDPNIKPEKFFEFIFANGVREVALPFSWVKGNLENVGNLAPYNTEANRGYLVEGYEGLGHDPDFGTPDQLWQSVEKASAESGFGENWTPIPSRETFAGYLDNYRNIGQNHTRDTMFGDLSFISIPNGLKIRGDLLGLAFIPGEDPGNAQWAVIRIFDEKTGSPLYTIARIQYQNQSTVAGDNSCMEIIRVTSRVCSPGTVLRQATLSAWDDPRRINGIGASREKMIELFSHFIHPPLITLQGDDISGGGGFHILYMDGAMVIKDIRTPSVTPDFFK